MKFYIGVTDNSWYSYLSEQYREDVNFWQPGGNMAFKVIVPGAPFLFKLKSPIDAIAGMGFFSSHTFLPVSVAWDVFGQGNGCQSLSDLQRMINAYRRGPQQLNPTIGCIVLTNPIFFRKEDWLAPQQDWQKNIVQGKSYATDQEIGRDFWRKMEVLLQKYLYEEPDGERNQLILEEPSSHYGNSILTKVRLGQGAFRVMVTDAYNRKCAISGEKTLPVLEAVHIRAFSASGPHFIANSLLLRSDIHKLFDAGYVTITPDLQVEVSKRIKEEFENGREYYKFHGSPISNLPHRVQDQPAESFVRWHNENVFLG